MAKDLADVLDVPDDETVLVLDPAARVGFRLQVRGIALSYMWDGSFRTKGSII